MNDFRATCRSVWGFDLGSPELADGGRWKIKHLTSHFRWKDILHPVSSWCNRSYCLFCSPNYTDEVYKLWHYPSQKLIKILWVYSFSVEIFLGFGPNSIRLSTPIWRARICHSNITKILLVNPMDTISQWRPCCYINVQSDVRARGCVWMSGHTVTYQGSKYELALSFCLHSLANVPSFLQLRSIKRHSLCPLFFGQSWRTDFGKKAVWASWFQSILKVDWMRWVIILYINKRHVGISRSIKMHKQFQLCGFWDDVEMFPWRIH